VIRRDELINSVVGLSPSGISLSVASVIGQFVGPVHPVDSGIDMMLIASSDLENARNPILLRLLPVHDLGGVAWSVDSGAVGDKDEALTKVLDAIDCGARVSKTVQRPGKVGSAGGDIRTKLLYLVMSTHRWLGVTRKWRSMLLLGSLNLPVGAKGEGCSGILGDGAGESSEPLRRRFLLFLSFSLWLGCSILKGHSAWVSSASTLDRFRAVAILARARGRAAREAGM
jgi:hypothetical protein